MKTLILSLALLVLPMAGSADEGRELRDHMGKLGLLWDDVWVKANSQKTWDQAADRVAEMRAELIQAIRHLPFKIVVMPEKERRMAEIDFHQHMARAIYLLSSLEQTLISPDVQPQSQSREQDVKNLLHEVSVVVGRAHAKFR